MSVSDQLKPRWLFVAYGGGHIRMVLPVMQRVRELGIAEVFVLALTTAHAVARDAGFEPLGFADFADATDAAALEMGAKLVADLAAPPTDLRESVAYLGLSYADLAAEIGAGEAAKRYAENGRQVFHPVRTLDRVIRRLKPDLVVATNSPRAERAAIDAAGRLQVPSVCLVDLFAIDEVAWIGKRGYGDRVCVLNDGVKQFLLGKGRLSGEVVVTGNPAFDALCDERWSQEGNQVRQTMLKPNKRRIMLFASSAEPASHPFAPGKTGDVQLPFKIAESLIDWSHRNPHWALWIKPHPSHAHAFTGGRFEDFVCHADWPLQAILRAVGVDGVVVVITSTIAVESSLLGIPVLRVLGSLFDRATPFAEMGYAGQSVALSGLHEGLECLIDAALAQPLSGPKLNATDAVLHELQIVSRR